MQNRPEQYFPRIKYKSDNKINKPLLEIKPLQRPSPLFPTQPVIEKPQSISIAEYKNLEEKNNLLSKELVQANMNIKKMNEQIMNLKKYIQMNQI
jgi:hypothetical protein